MKSVKNSFEYKWVIVFISCLMVFCVLGFCSSANSMYITPITEALNISRASYSVTTGVRYITTALVNIFFASLIYRFGEKKMIIAGFASLIMSTFIYSISTSVMVFALGSIFLGIGLSFTTTAMVGTVVNKWCAKNKGTIMGIALASNGIGAAIARVILTPIINSGDPFGYRNAYRICVKEDNMVYMYSDEAMPRQHIDIPMPVMNCKFDDEETIKKLNKFKNNRKTGGDTNGV